MVHTPLEKLMKVFPVVNHRRRWLAAFLLCLFFCLLCGINPRIVMKTRIRALGAWGGVHISKIYDVDVTDSVNYGIYEDIYRPTVTQVAWFRIEWWRQSDRRMRF